MNLALPASGALLLGLLPCLGAERAPANELRRDHIPADAKMVLHVDVDALKATTFWKIAMAEADTLDMDDELDELADFEEEFGINPLEDVKSVTLYSKDLDDEPSAALIVTSSRIDDALDVLRARIGYDLINDGGMDLHTFDDDGEGFVAHIDELANGDRLVILGEDVSKVVQAARVVHGDEASLSQDSSALQARPGVGSFLYVEVVGGIPDEYEPASQVLGLAQGIQIDLGEAGGSLFAHAAVATESAESAMDVADTIDGLLALGRLAMSSDGVPPEAKQLLRSLRVNTKGSSVTLDFEYDVQSLFTVIEALEEGIGH